MKKKFIIFFIIYIIIASTPLVTVLQNPISIKTFLSKINENNVNNNILENQSKNHKQPQMYKSISKIKKLSQKTEPEKIEKSQIKELDNLIIAAKNYNNIEVKPKNQATEDSSLNKTIDSDGYFEILNLQNGKIEHVSEKDYVIGAVCAEMPPTFHPEALKAQAVSAHTYALKMKKEQQQNPDPDLKGADFSADPLNWKKYVTKEIAQKKFGDKFEQYWGKIVSAVNDVTDIVMLYDDEPIIAAYHAISSGITESAHVIWGGDAPYLKATESYGDNLAPNYETKVCVSADKAKRILTQNYPDLKLSSSPSKWFNDVTRSASGSVLNVNLENSDISGTKIRTLFDLRSANFIVNYDSENNNFEFTVKGYGHDIGLSQYGADYMAQNGSDFKEILNHYYSDISFAKVSKIS